MRYKFVFLLAFLVMQLSCAKNLKYMEDLYDMDYYNSERRDLRGYRSSGGSYRSYSSSYRSSSSRSSYTSSSSGYTSSNAGRYGSYRNTAVTYNKNYNPST